MPGRRADGNDAIVGRNIRVHRLARTMSQTGLADAIGVTFQQVQKYEKGVNRVGSGRLVRIANALDVPVMTLLRGVPGAAARTADASPVALIAKRAAAAAGAGVRGDRGSDDAPRAAGADGGDRGDGAGAEVKGAAYSVRSLPIARRRRAMHGTYRAAARSPV